MKRVYKAFCREPDAIDRSAVRQVVRASALSDAASGVRVQRDLVRRRQELGSR